MCDSTPRSEFIIGDSSVSLNYIEDSLIEFVQDDRTPKIFRRFNQNQHRLRNRIANLSFNSEDSPILDDNDRGNFDT